MNRWIPYLFFIALFIFFTGYDLYGKTEQEMLQEHAKWVEILGLNGFSAEPVQTFKFWDSVDKKEVVHINGKGLYLTFDAKTGELIEIFNEYQSSLRCKAQDAGKRIAFSLNKESCKDKIREYYKLITGEDLPNFDFYLPPAGTVLLPTDGIGHGWKRAYKGYYFRKDYMTITLFADTGQLKRYIKRYISDLPPTVEVKISAEQARQKAIEIADKEIKDWVKFLDSISTETAISQLDDKTYRGIKNILKGEARGIKQESQQYASLIGCKPIETKAPYLEIVNIQTDAFHRQYMQPEAYEKSHEWNPATRLCWVINLYYHNPETKVGAQFEVDIDAYDGSVVNGSRPWD